MAEDKHMTLAEAVAQVQRSVVVPKARYNAHGNFYYRSMEDIVAALKETVQGGGNRLHAQRLDRADRRALLRQGHVPPVLRGRPRRAFGDRYVRPRAFEPEGHERGAGHGQRIELCPQVRALCGAFDIDGTSDPDTLMGDGKPAEKEPPEFGQFIAKCKSCGTSYRSRAASSTSSSRPTPGCCPSPAWQVV